MDFSHVLSCAFLPVLFLNPCDPAQMLKTVLHSPLSNHNSNFFSFLLLNYSCVILLFIPSCHSRLSLSAITVFTSVFQVLRPICIIAHSSHTSSVNASILFANGSLFSSAIFHTCLAHLSGSRDAILPSNTNFSSSILFSRLIQPWVGLASRSVVSTYCPPSYLSFYDL